MVARHRSHAVSACLSARYSPAAVVVPTRECIDGARSQMRFNGGGRRTGSVRHDFR